MSETVTNATMRCQSITAMAYRLPDAFHTSEMKHGETQREGSFTPVFCQAVASLR